MEHLREVFPNIITEGFKVTSDQSPDYNCFAHALGNNSQWWSPIENKGYYWHWEVTKGLKVENYCQLYERVGGYLPCDSSAPEIGFEKIALYADTDGQVTHAAKQTATGKWTSKLGDWEDIEHNTVTALEGDFYGKAVQFLKRAVT